MYPKIKEAAQFLKQQLPQTPDVVLVLGSGLASLSHAFDEIKRIPFKDIPNFLPVTVEGQKGELVLCRHGQKNILIQAGRLHYYEGYSMQDCTLPIRVYTELGIPEIIFTNASGGVNPSYEVGDVILVKDHINLFPEHPLRGTNLSEYGPRFLDMSKAYDPILREKLLGIARSEQIHLREGIYLGLQGPSFETPAEYGMVRILGGDLVGMSTVPEVIVARHGKMKVACLSVVTDLGGPDISPEVSHKDVLKAAKQASKKIERLLKTYFSETQ